MLSNESAVAAHSARDILPPRAVRARGGWTAILLAGERPGGDPLARAMGQTYKALIQVAGRSMLARSAEALLASPSVTRVVILAQEPEAMLVGDTAALAAHPRVRLAVSAARIATSIAAVAGTEIAPWPVLVTTADHALLTPEMIETFIAGAGERDVAIGVGERRHVETRYPMTQRTWLKFSDGHYSGANLFALQNARVASALALWSGVEQHRKTVWRLVTKFGPWLLLRTLTRSIGFEDAIQRAGNRLGISAVAVILPQPEAAIDVDKQSDLRLVETILSNRFRRRQRPQSHSRERDNLSGRGAVSSANTRRR